MNRNYRPLFCAQCRAMLLIPKELTEPPAPWRIHLKMEDDHATAHAFCGEACQDKGAVRPEGQRVSAFIDLDRTKGPLTQRGAYDALLGFLTPLSQHDEYLDGHRLGMELRRTFENWPPRVT